MPQLGTSLEQPRDYFFYHLSQPPVSQCGAKLYPWAAKSNKHRDFDLELIVGSMKPKNPCPQELPINSL
jgi:hypothetical protein